MQTMCEGNRPLSSESPQEPSNPSPAPERPAPRPRTHSQQRSRRNSVFQYITILFAAAFILLLLTLVMERRQHAQLQEESEEQINNLQQSVSAVQSLQNLYDENGALKDQVDELEAAQQELENDAANLRSMVESLSVQLEKTKEAMDYFWQIDEAYVRGRYALCRSLIETMEDVSAGSALKEYLPRESTTDNDRFSPYDRYQEIRGALY